MFVCLIWGSGSFTFLWAASNCNQDIATTYYWAAAAVARAACRAMPFKYHNSNSPSIFFVFETRLCRILCLFVWFGVQALSPFCELPPFEIKTSTPLTTGLRAADVHRAACHAMPVKYCNSNFFLVCFVFETKLYVYPKRYKNSKMNLVPFCFWADWAVFGWIAVLKISAILLFKVNFWGCFYSSFHGRVMMALYYSQCLWYSTWVVQRWEKNTGNPISNQT